VATIQLKKHREGKESLERVKREAGKLLETRVSI